MTGEKSYWSLEDIPWDKVDRTKVSPMILRLAKAASLVEFNGGDYADYLCRVFSDDPEFCQAARHWGTEEIQHGEALAKWAAIVDPSYNFSAASKRFSKVITLPEVAESVRGSRAGELIARCMVEVGTSSYYSALRDAADEPVLKVIAHRIAQDEIRHYKLFHTHLERYLSADGMRVRDRIRLALARVLESQDDELAYAYYAANFADDVVYERTPFARAYSAEAESLYQPHHVERAVRLTMKAVGLSQGPVLTRTAVGIGWSALRVHRAWCSAMRTDLPQAA